MNKKIDLVNVPHLPDIVGFEELFSTDEHEQSYSKQSNPQEQTKELRGLPGGSCILITGLPGAGKTILALSLVRSLMKKQGYENSKLCYISTEIDRKKLEKDFTTFGWFRKAHSDGNADFEDQIFSEKRVLIPHMPELGPFHEARDSSSLVDLVLKQTRLEVEKDQILKSKTGNPIFVIIDSLTAILKDSKDTGERRAQAARCITNLSETMFRDHLGLLFVLSEQSTETEMDMKEVPPEEYLADIVFRLGTKDTGGGCRLRTLEITKSRAVKMLIGEHSYAIVTEKGLGDVIAQTITSHQVREKAKENFQNGKSNWATVIVAPRTRLPSIGPENQVNQENVKSQQSQDTMLCSGTPGLDAMLLGKFPGTQRHVNHFTASKTGGLQPGSTTLILGGSGAGKTMLALQFLLEHGFQKGEDATINNIYPLMKETLYVNFENPPAKVIDKFPGSDDAKKALKNCEFLYRHGRNMDVNLLLLEMANVIRTGIKRVVVDGLSDLIQATARNQDYAHLIEALLHTIGYAGNGETTTMLTYEMPSNLETFLPPTQVLSIAADNIIVLRHQQISNELQKTIFVLKARGQRSDRQVREIAIFKDHDKPLEVRSGRLELYSNLLVGEPKFIRASLHFFAENPAERKFNNNLVDVLHKRFGHELDLNVLDFSRPEMTGTLIEMLSPERRITSSNLNIISIDEWWIREYEEERTRRQELLDYLLELDEFCVTSQDVTYHQSDINSRHDSCRDYRSDFLAFEVEKASRVQIREKSEPNLNSPAGQNDPFEPKLETLAVPNYQDYGLFCVNRPIWRQLFPHWHTDSQMSDGRDEWNWFLQELPRVWAELDDNKNIVVPKEMSDDKPITVLDVITRAKKKHDNNQKSSGKSPFVGFAFDMESPHTLTCVFLELCWSFGADEDFLVKDAIKYKKSEVVATDRNKGLPPQIVKNRSIPKSHPAVLAIRLLQHFVKHKLMPTRTTLEDCKHALFSRQWYSTLCEIATEELKKRKKDQKKKNKLLGKNELDHSNDDSTLPSVFPIVFFPLGSKVPYTPSNKRFAAFRYVTLQRAMKDIYKRFDRIAKRVLVTLKCRIPNVDNKIIAPFDKVITDAEAAWNNYVSGRQKNRKNIDKSLHKPLIKELGSLANQLHDLVHSQHVFQPYRPIAENLPTTGIDKSLWAYLPASRSLDIRDVDELLRGHRFRLNLIQAEIDGKRLTDVLNDQKIEGDTKPTYKGNNESVSTLTGYAASGSWLIGVTKPVQSPGVAWNMIEEITSHSNACERSKLGAGIPSRKDFFEFHGNESVTHAKHLTWSELLKYAGSRARRRDRTICSACSVSRLTAIVDRQIRFCLSEAERNKDDDDLCNIAIDAFEEIMQDLIEQISRKWRKPTKSCGNSIICPHTEPCCEAYKKP